MKVQACGSSGNLAGTSDGLQRLGDKVKQDLLQDLQAERIAPKLILFDKYLQNLSPGIKEFFENHYEPVNTGVIWKRKVQNHE